MPISVLYVAGVNRSGSTLLDRTVGQIDGHWSVGEMGAYIWRRSLSLDWPCGCGEPFFSCPFWTKVGEVAFGGWDTVDVKKFGDLQQTVDRTKRIPLILWPRLSPSFARRLEEYSEILDRLYKAVQEVSGAAVIVDSSKQPSTAYLLRRLPDIQLSIVHNVRDPRGVVYSWSKKDFRNSPGKDDSTGVMPTWTARHTCRHWVTNNLLVGGLRKIGVPLVRVRYEDFVQDPGRELSRVSAMLGSTFGSDTERFVRPGELELRVSHTAAGNPSRFKTGWVTIRADEEWQSKLPGAKRWFTSVATWPLRTWYGYRLRGK